MLTNCKLQSHPAEPEAETLETPGPSVGQLAGVNGKGEILVRVADGPIRTARLLADLDAAELGHPEQIDREVLLIHLEGDSERPVIVGLLSAPVEEPNAENERSEIIADGQRLHIRAQQEIVLQCGKSSITLRKDGKIVIKGKHLLSRATGTHRIKGGRVDIN